MRKTVIAVSIAVMLPLALAGCAKQESPAAAEAAFDAADEAMPASAPMPEPQEARAKVELSNTPVGGAADAAMADKPMEEALVETDTGATPDQLSSTAATYEDGKRRFVRTAQAQFRVKDVYRSALAIEDVAAAQGGFVVDNTIETQTQSVQRRPAGEGKLIELAEYTVHGRLSVRVPSANAQAFLRAIAKEMEFLDRRAFQANDVQFELLRRELTRRREELAQQQLGEIADAPGRADRRAEVVAARSGAMQQRDEALVAQKQYEDRIEFATIDLNLYQLPKIRQTELTDVDAVFRANGPGFFSRLGESLRVGWYGVLDLLLFLLRAWPAWLLLGVGAYGFRRWLKARRARRTPPPVPATGG